MYLCTYTVYSLLPLPHFWQELRTRDRITASGITPPGYITAGKQVRDSTQTFSPTNHTFTSSPRPRVLRNVRDAEKKIWGFLGLDGRHVTRRARPCFYGIRAIVPFVYLS
jgi:hypothetical protein